MILFWTNPFIQKHSGRFFFPLKLEMAFVFFQFQEVSDSMVFISFHVQSVWKVWRGHSLENYTSAPKRKQWLPAAELPGCCGWNDISISEWGRVSCWPVGGKGRIQRDRSFSSSRLFVHTFLLHSPDLLTYPLRPGHIDRLKVHSGTWTRKDNKTCILLTKIFSHILGYGLTHSRHQIKLTKCYKEKKEGEAGNKIEGRREGRKEEGERREKRNSEGIFVSFAGGGRLRQGLAI